MIILLIQYIIIDYRRRCVLVFAYLRRRGAYSDKIIILNNIVSYIFFL